MRQVRAWVDPAWALVAGAAMLAGPLAGQTVHRLPATPSTVAWGYYWAEARPVLRVASGDIVEVETLLTSSPARLEAAGVAPADVEPSLRAVYDQVTDRGPGGHILTGPIYVVGAEPGDVLEVKILSVGLPIGYGYNGCSGFLPDRCGDPRTRILPLDRERMISPVLPGVTVPLRPFFGSMGVAPPPSEGRVSSNPPSTHAGNLDNRELVAGTSLFIPVHVPGALFEVGDGHAAQGDGEVDQTAIETSLTGRLQLVVHKGRSLTWPRAETPTHWIAMGTDEDLTVATRTAVGQAVDLLMDVRGLPEGEAYRLVSIACSVRVTELVDGKVGVHVMIPKGIFEEGAGSPGTSRIPTEAIQVDAPPSIEHDALVLQEQALDALEGGAPGSGTDLAAGVDHAVPGYVGVFAEGGHRIAHLSRVAGEARNLRHLPVAGHAAGRDPPHDVVDSRVCAHAANPGRGAGRTQTRGRGTE